MAVTTKIMGMNNPMAVEIPNLLFIIVTFSNEEIRSWLLAKFCDIHFFAHQLVADEELFQDK